MLSPAALATAAAGKHVCDKCAILNQKTGSQSSPYGVATQTQQIGWEIECRGSERQETEEGEAAETADTIKDNEADIDPICQVLFILEIKQHRTNSLVV